MPAFEFHYVNREIDVSIAIMCPYISEPLNNYQHV